MRKLLFTSAAAVLFSGSFAYADNPLIPNDNDNMAARSFAIEQSKAAGVGRSAARMVRDGGAVTTATSAGSRVSPGFLLHGGDHKKVENQYAR